jgi:Zn-dependent protease/CBS domain-containing protein
MTQAPTPSTPSPRERGSFARARTVFRVRGVPVRIDASWLIIAALVTWVFHSRMAVSPALTDLGGGALLASAAIASLLFFASLLAHELGHAFTSLDRDIPVLGITLFLLGGVTESTREAQRARDEFVIVGIGPFISLVLAGAFGIAHLLLEGVQPVATIVGYLAWTNLLLAVFNLVPGYPLDGGRLLRSILWGITGQPHRSTRWAARVGQAFALLVAGVGLSVLVRQTGGTLGGIWEILIGVFLFKGATDSHRRARFRERLAGRTARTVMGSIPPTLDPALSVREALERVRTRPSLLWPVGSPLIGAVAIPDIDAVPESAWDRTAVGEIAHPADGITVDPDESIPVILDRIVEAPHQMLLVARDGEPVGLITPSLLMEPTSG